MNELPPILYKLLGLKPDATIDEIVERVRENNDTIHLYATNLTLVTGALANYFRAKDMGRADIEQKYETKLREKVGVKKP
jgi:hypothetical protein